MPHGAGSAAPLAVIAVIHLIVTAKSAITGTDRKLGPDHAARHLASFAWRYNRRYHLKTMIPRFVHNAARTRPMPYQTLIAG